MLIKPAKKGSREEKELLQKKRIEEPQAEIADKDAKLQELLKNIAELPDLSGAELTNMKYGSGKVTEQKGKYLDVLFESGMKTFALPDCIAEGYLKGAEQEVADVCKLLKANADEEKKLSQELRQLKTELSSLE